MVGDIHGRPNHPVELEEPVDFLSDLAGVVRRFPMVEIVHSLFESHDRSVLIDYTFELFLQLHEDWIMTMGYSITP